MKLSKTIPILAASLVASVHADPPISTSASFTLLPAPVGPGGGTVSGGDITAEVSIGDTSIDGVSNVTIRGVQEKGGFTGQLYDPRAISISASPASVNEGQDRKLDGDAVMDDDTRLELDPSELVWGVVSGPVAGINANGLATAGIVYEDTTATVRGTWLGAIGDFDLTVLNVGKDDYLSYAGDGLDDDWQVFFFGEENPDAAPGKNPDGDRNDNRFEFLAGVDPTDPVSFFSVAVDHDASLGEADIVFSPRFTDRSYRVMGSTLLTTADWTEVTGGTVSDNGDGRTVTDPNAAGSEKFYRIEITRP